MSRNLARIRLLASGAALITAVASAQEFDVVDVRPAPPLAAGMAQVMLDEGPAVIELNPTGVSHILARPFTENGTVTLRFYTMRLLITAAYKEVIRDEYLVGGPNWLDSDHFDLIGKTVPGTSVDQMKLMLQRALADRFHLAVHREQRPMPVFDLVVSKRGKLRAAARSGEAVCRYLEDHQECRNMTMTELAHQLPMLAPHWVDRPVFDATGLGGAYDFYLDPHPRAQAPEDRKTIFDVLNELGLRLQERKQPATVIVIDHVEHPDAN